MYLYRICFNESVLATFVIGHQRRIRTGDGGIGPLAIHLMGRFNHGTNINIPENVIYGVFCNIGVIILRNFKHFNDFQHV